MHFIHEALQKPSRFGVDLRATISNLPSSDQMQSALSSAGSVSDTISSTSQAISQGSSLFDAATAASGGDYSAVASAAQSLASDLPPGTATDFIKDVAEVVGAAAAGAGIGQTIGSAVPVFGTIIGAEAGAVIGAGVQIVREAWPMLVADDGNVFKFAGQIVGSIIQIFTGSQANPQPDYRYLRERMCFPAIPLIPNNSSVTGDGYYGVVPGTVNANPRTKPNSTFYQTQAGPNQNWSLEFNFLITWLPSNGKGKASTRLSRAAAWALAQYYCRSFSKRLGHDVSKAVSWETVVAAFAASYPGMAMRPDHAKTAPQRAAKALAKVYAWYGDPALFNTTIPFASTQGVPQNVQNNQQGVAALIQEFRAHPLDYLYYPVPVKHDLDNKVFVPCKPSDRTDVFLSPDTTLEFLCELAYFDVEHRTAFQSIVLAAHMWNKAQLTDKQKWPGIEIGPHANFMRCLGHISAAVRKSGEGHMTPQQIAQYASRSRTAKPLSHVAGDSDSTAALTTALPASTNSWTMWLLPIAGLSSAAFWWLMGSRKNLQK